MRNHSRPVNLKVRIGNRPVELPWSSSALSGVPDREINAWLDRENLTPPELGALASVLGRLACPSDLTPLGDPQLGRVSKVAKKRLPAVVVRQLKQLQAKQKKLVAERKAKKQAIAAAKAQVAVTPTPLSPSYATPVPAPTNIPATPEPVKADIHEPVVEPLVSPEDRTLPAASASPAPIIAVSPLVTPAVVTASPMAAPVPPAPVLIPDLIPVSPAPVPQVVVQVPGVATGVQPSPALRPSPEVQPSLVPGPVATVPVSPAYVSPVIPNVLNYRPNTPLPTEYSYGFDTPEDTESSEEWDESYEEFGAAEPVKSVVPEFLAGIGLLGALAWFAMRKA